MTRQRSPKRPRAGESKINILRLDGKPTDPATERELRRVIEQHLPTLEEHGIDLFADAIRLLVVRAPREPSSPSENEQGSSQEKRSWQANFLDWLRRGQTVQRAAELSGVTPRWAYSCRKADPEFRQQWIEAIS